MKKISKEGCRQGQGTGDPKEDELEGRNVEALSFNSLSSEHGGETQKV